MFRCWPGGRGGRRHAPGRAGRNDYDGAGNLVKRTGLNGKVTQYTYNEVGCVTEVLADPTGLARRTGYRYDANGNVTQVARPGRARTRRARRRPRARVDTPRQRGQPGQRDDPQVNRR
ncbi:hypothetical protein K7G98_13925 [Saccharothrix sp. MB29]|nr:hypothetical protein [Saccharothrix sp. MB29]